MTPYEIDVLMHYHTRGNDHADVFRDPPVWRPTINAFIGQNLLRPNVPGSDRSYSLTDRGKAYCEFLTQMPLPVAKWVMP